LIQLLKEGEGITPTRSDIMGYPFILRKDLNAKIINYKLREVTGKEWNQLVEQVGSGMCEWQFKE
jgi:hypothetical protein